MASIVVCSQSALLIRNLVASLRPYGHRILKADSSIALISACLTKNVDLVIIDSDLDFLSETGAIRCLRYTPQTEHLPIVALTNDTLDYPEVFAAGADFALAKPFAIRSLARNAARLIGHYHEVLEVSS